MKTNNLNSRERSLSEQAGIVHLDFDPSEGEPYATIPHHLYQCLPIGAIRLLAALQTLPLPTDISTASLAAMMGRSVGMIQKSIKELEAEGAITRQRSRGRRTITLGFPIPDQEGEVGR